jgi:hypothetical protein
VRHANIRAARPSALAGEVALYQSGQHRGLGRGIAARDQVSGGQGEPRPALAGFQARPSAHRQRCGQRRDRRLGLRQAGRGGQRQAPARAAVTTTVV